MVSTSSKIAPAVKAADFSAKGIKKVICMKITKLGPDLLPKPKEKSKKRQKLVANVRPLLPEYDQQEEKEWLCSKSSLGADYEQLMTDSKLRMSDVVPPSHKESQVDSVDQASDDLTLQGVQLGVNGKNDARNQKKFKKDNTRRALKIKDTFTEPMVRFESPMPYEHLLPT